LNVLKQGDSFWNDKYNGYDLSYLAIRFLYENLKNEEFKSLISDLPKIKEYGNNLVSKMFDYYDEKFKNV